MKIAIVVPHIFMNQDILPDVIFSPGYLAIDLAEGLQKLGQDVTLFTPGRVNTNVKNIFADLSLFEKELTQRGDKYIDLLKKHPLIFINMARQVQAEIIANVFKMANVNEFDVVHIYTNEEELGIAFADLCNKPVVFTHHEPFNFSVKYRSIMPKYKNRNWISISNSQRKSMPSGTNFIATIYHGMDTNKFVPIKKPSQDYIAYFGRIIEPKGVHLAIEAAKTAGVELRIAGKHYSDYAKDKYWSDIIEPQIDGNKVKYVGFLKTDIEKQDFLGNAKALIVPSTWEEPFGMVMIEALACGTPVVGITAGAIPEVIEDRKTGLLVDNDKNVVKSLVDAINNIDSINRNTCRQIFEERFSIERMCKEHLQAYKAFVK